MTRHEPNGRRRYQMPERVTNQQRLEARTYVLELRKTMKDKEIAEKCDTKRQYVCYIAAGYESAPPESIRRVLATRDLSEKQKPD